MPDHIEFQYLTPLDSLDSYDEPDEVLLLRPLVEDARRFLEGHSWCPGIAEGWLGYGIGKVIALLLFRLKQPIGVDEYLWVVTGDLPSAYFVTDGSPNPAQALETYCELMDDWANSILEGADLSDCFPVKAEPTEKHARLLLTRTAFIKRDILPEALLGPRKEP